MIKCQFENGDSVQLRHVVVNALVIKDGKILLGKRGTFQGKKIVEHGKWGLIGGYLDRDETLIEGMRREILEEAGWEVEDLKLFVIKDNPISQVEDKQNVNFIYLVKPVKKVGQGDEEVQELKWFDLNQLPNPEEIAFDHEKSIEAYKKYLIKPFSLPAFISE